MVAMESKHDATFVIGDQVKETSSRALQCLRDMGIETWMITGDNEGFSQGYC